MLSTPAKASHPTYSYGTTGNYKWYKNGNYLVNEVDASKDNKSTKLSVFYNNPVNGVMYTGDEDPIGKDTKLGNFTAYVLTNTSNDQNSSDFSVNNVGTYYVLFNEDTKKVYDIVYIPDPVPYAYVNRYKFWIGGDEAKKVYFLHSEGGGDNWYGDYLKKIGKDVKDKKPGLIMVSNPPQPPAASGATATGTITSGSTTTTDSTGTDKCGRQQIQCEKTPDPPTLPANEDIPTISESLKMGNISTAWALSLDLVNVLAIFVLLAIAFANILHLGERESFSFKRMIPAFVVGLIAANFSHLICRAIIDFAGMLMNFFVPKEHAFDTMFNIMIGMFSGWFGNTGTMEWGIAGAGAIGVAVVGILAGGGCGLILIGLIILFFPAIIMFVLMFLLAARTYILWFLVILSPIAFFGMFFDPLKRTIGTWWNWFLMWTFMGPIAYFFIYLAEGFARNTEGTADVICFDPLGGDPNQVGGFTKYLIVNILLILSVYVPYALGSKIGMGLWGGVGKFLGATGAKLGFGAGGKAVERLGRATKWKGLQNIGAGIRQVPYMPEAMFGREGMFATINKSKVGEAQTDIKSRLRSGLIGKTGLMDDVVQGDMLAGRERVNTWSAEGLVSWMNTGIKNDDRKKMAEGVNWLGAMAVSGEVPIEERRRATEALDALGYSAKDINATIQVPRLVDIAKNSKELEIRTRRDGTTFYQAKNHSIKRKNNAEKPLTRQEAAPVEEIIHPNEVKPRGKPSPVAPEIPEQFEGGAGI
ncbi:hypothetical protein KJ713_01840 [Patescibacteria group bacterium]|nr:hypothetical protein [Patescibacteria group bacterium]